MKYITSAEGETLTVYDGENGTVVLALNGVEATLPAEELVDLIIGASPAVAMEVGAITTRVIQTYLEKQVGTPN